MATRSYSFRGNSYIIECNEGPPQDASWFTYEDESSVRDRDWTIQPGDWVLDIGCGFGSYAMTALASGAKFVYCFNPNTYENELMLKSAAHNGWSDKIIANTSGLYSNTGWLNDLQQIFSTTEVEGSFRVLALDDCTIETDKIDWMKLDVEGAEVEVLKGARNLIQKFKPKILIENHTFKIPSIPEQVDEFLSNIGYELLSRHPYHGVSHSVHIPKP